MFCSYLGCYIALFDGKIAQRHLCAWFDTERAEAFTQEMLETRGYICEEIRPARYVFKHPEKGYLSFAYDMGVMHTVSVGKTELFQKVDPDVLPEPVNERPLAKGIEKNIHQTGKSIEYPEIFRKNRASLTQMNAEYEYFYWTEGGFFDIEKFILDYYGENILEYYKVINSDYGAARADFFRYLCLYAVGGVYIDLKSAIAKPLSEIIRSEDRLLLSYWWHGARQHPEVQHMIYGEYEQYYIICASGHPIMRRTIHQVMCLLKIYQPDMQGVGRHGTLITTGPIVYGRMIESYLDEGPTRQIHSLTNGIEYTILGDDGGHEKHTASSMHYSQCTSPIVGK